MALRTWLAVGSPVSQLQHTFLPYTPVQFQNPPARGKMKLYCAIVGKGETAFSVLVDEKNDVDDLKDEIKKKQMFNFPADKLQLFLAKKEKCAGPWLTETELKEGVNDAGDLEQLDAAGAPLNLVGLSEEDVRFQPTKEHVKEKTIPIHVLVVVPECTCRSTKRPCGGSLYV
ncbi:unnamed protein product [Phytophthora lilii]|uniref:Unnamed protein product n=1 Tax=Phytophthora lilii TaxID=2077276 RepID=A0A9W6TPT0_9STRA|nr:unnamed protein product [Phytophthora lilii]